MIKNIVLDMGNVLLSYDPHVILNKVCDTEEEKQKFAQEYGLDFSCYEAFLIAEARSPSIPTSIVSATAHRTDTANPAINTTLNRFVCMTVLLSFADSLAEATARTLTA